MFVNLCCEPREMLTGTMVVQGTRSSGTLCLTACWTRPSGALPCTMSGSYGMTSETAQLRWKRRCMRSGTHQRVRHRRGAQRIRFLSQPSNSSAGSMVRLCSQRQPCNNFQKGRRPIRGLQVAAADQPLSGQQGARTTPLMGVSSHWILQGWWTRSTWLRVPSV